MGIYNYSVLKSNPLEVKAVIDGMSTTILAYRIKFHGSDTCFEDLAPWVKKKWWPKKYDFKTTYSLLKDRAEVKWGNESPVYGISTPGYDGKVKWDSPGYEKGLTIWKIASNAVAWQEDDGFERCIGRVKKQGRQLVFTPVGPEEELAEV